MLARSSLHIGQLLLGLLALNEVLDQGFGRLQTAIALVETLKLEGPGLLENSLVDLVFVGLGCNLLGLKAHGAVLTH